MREISPGVEQATWSGPTPQDAAGAIGRSVADVAALLSTMAGSDPSDPATTEADQHKQDYSAALKADALQGWV